MAGSGQLAEAPQRSKACHHWRKPIRMLGLAVMDQFNDFGALRPWFRQPEAVLADVVSVAEHMAGVHVQMPIAAGFFPLFRQADVQAAVLDGAGNLLLASPGFAVACDPAAVAAAAAGQPPAAMSIAAPDGTPAIIVHAPAAAASGWPLPPDIAAALRPGLVVAITSAGSITGRPLADAAAAFGLSGLEARVTIATIETGSIRLAAARLGIAYQTAREAVAAAMRRVGVNRVPALVSRLSSLGFGILPFGPDDTSLLADAWGISPRQATLGLLLAQGLSRAEAAAALGLSDAVIKKTLEGLYQILGVTSAASLARLLAEANAMAWVMQATAGEIGRFDSSREPLRFALRADGSRVAFSDYGPASGRPVLVVHSSMTTRFVSRRLVKALQARGFRPIAIDRPGFGLSDPLPGLVAGAHNPFEAAVADVELVADQLRPGRIDLVSRGAAHHVLALGRALPDRLGRVVITNPDPDSASDPRRMGFLGAAKEAQLRRPALVRAMSSLMAGQLTEAKFPRIFARSLEGSPPDEAAMTQADIVEDYWRSVRPFATGRIDGYVNEQTQHATMAPAKPLPGTVNWHFMVAEHDTLYDPAFVMDYWRRTLPDASCETVPGSGRLLAMTHADLVADRLAQG